MSDSANVVEPPGPENVKKTPTVYRCELFPTRTSIFVFTSYVLLCSTQYVLVKASQTADDYTYNTTSVVFITEALKLLIAAAALIVENHALSRPVEVAISRWRLLILYLIPSALYCMSNNLVFVNLRYFEPTTYNVLQQLKIVLTGILYQMILKKTLSLRQWFAIILLTVGCVIKQLGVSEKSFFGSCDIVNLQGALLFLQISCTALSGVFNESLIKTDTHRSHNGIDAGDSDIMIHNLFMYLDSVLCNFFVLVCRGRTHDLIDVSELSSIFAQPLVLAVIVNGAVSGIMVSLFLKHFDSIVRVFTGSMEMTLMAFVCWLSFGTPIDAWTVVAIAVVSVATYLFAKDSKDSASRTNLIQSGEKDEEIQIITEPRQTEAKAAAPRDSTTTHGEVPNSKSELMYKRKRMSRT
ncbi:UDP-galactose transporter senju-like [Galendromus occidentalis]|uniref:UDP-galactose transporter senju-like n=1 Tax=Galendromus occidentalis TaxID=34638 RepID=A0AAJ6QNX3_9ACAR|nr:UDP-galactose transporter senju-like [Galendromus occidentalis]